MKENPTHLTTASSPSADVKQQDDMEQRIIEAAQQLFIEKGFVETSMGDIAARVGVNRPAINYYFRTKERLFAAVLGGIVSRLVPRVLSTVLEQSLSMEERVSRVVDIYYELFHESPALPLFLVREMNRDFSLIIDAAISLNLTANLMQLSRSIEAEMEQGRLRKVPIRVVFVAFVSQLIVPFIGRPIVENALLEEGESFDDFLTEWKPYVVKRMKDLLEPEK